MSTLEGMLQVGEIAVVRHGLWWVYVRRPRTVRPRGPEAGWVVLVQDYTPAYRDPRAQPRVRMQSDLTWSQALAALEREGVSADFDWRLAARLPVAPDVPARSLTP